MNFDLIIRGGTVVDGSGKRDPFPADVGVRGGRIQDVGDLSGAQSGGVIDARGKMVAPGFIDVHVHGELALLGGRDQFAEVRQGITTQLTAPDGFGWARLTGASAREMWDYTRFGYGEVEVQPPWPSIDAYLALFERKSPSNVLLQVPHCAVRLEVMGWDARPASDDELTKMGSIVREWMEAGAAALNLGLDYQPTANADFRELVQLCNIVAEYGGIYAAHQRYQIVGRLRAWQETIKLSRKAGVPVHVSHERVDEEIFSTLEQVENEGIDLTFESYLYPAGMTHVNQLLLMKYQTGKPDDVLERLRDPEVRDECLPRLKETLGRCDQIVGYTRSGRYVGERLFEVAEKESQSPESLAYDIMLEGSHAFIFPWQISPQEAGRVVETTVRHERMMIASDGSYNVHHPHPRSHGCFVRVLGEFVRERNLLSLSEAVHKMSGFPASRFALRERGGIESGKAADLVVFNPETVGTPSTFDHPNQPPTGIDFVIVNGEPVVVEGVPTEARPGRVLRRG